MRTLIAKILLVLFLLLFFKVYAQETWTSTSLVNALRARIVQTDIWTGSKMIVWGDGNKYEIKMLMGKTSYKAYEPIYAQFELVNHDSTPLEIRGLFNPFIDAAQTPNVTIRDDKGGVWTRNKKALMDDALFIIPEFIIQPSETLYVSMEINNWAADAKTSDNYYFKLPGYFPPGKYRAYFSGYIDENDQVDCQSNEFTVEDNNAEDMEILKLYKERKLEEIINKYPDNPFTEHVLAEYISSKDFAYYTAGNDAKWIPIVQSDYEGFFSKYPNSYYQLYNDFMAVYINVLASQHSSSDETIADIKNRVPNEMMRRYLLNKQRVDIRMPGYKYERHNK